MARDKVKRAFVWMRKSLRIIDKTTLPGEIVGEIRPIIDLFGWERLNESTARITTSGANVNTITSTAVPADVLRLILEASVETSNTALAFTVWMDHLDDETNVNVGVMRPLDIPISGVSIRSAITRPVFMRPGDQLSGRCTPATGVGETLTLRERFVDLSIGEYIPAL